MATSSREAHAPHQSPRHSTTEPQRPVWHLIVLPPFVLSHDESTPPPIPIHSPANTVSKLSTTSHRMALGCASEAHCQLPTASTVAVNCIPCHPLHAIHSMPSTPCQAVRPFFDAACLPPLRSCARSPWKRDRKPKEISYKQRNECNPSAKSKHDRNVTTSPRLTWIQSVSKSPAIGRSFPRTVCVASWCAPLFVRCSFVAPFVRPPTNERTNHQPPTPHTPSLSTTPNILGLRFILCPYQRYRCISILETTLRSLRASVFAPSIHVRRCYCRDGCALYYCSFVRSFVGR